MWNMKKIQYILCICMALALTGCYSSSNVVDEPLRVANVSYYHVGADGYYVSVSLVAQCVTTLSDMLLVYELDGKSYVVNAGAEERKRFSFQSGKTSFAFPLNSEKTESARSRQLKSLVAVGSNSSPNLLSMVDSTKLTFHMPDFTAPMVQVDMRAMSERIGSLKWELIVSSPMPNLMRYDVFLHIGKQTMGYYDYEGGEQQISAIESGTCEVYAEVVVYLDNKEAITYVTPRQDVKIL